MQGNLLNNQKMNKKDNCNLSVEEMEEIRSQVKELMARGVQIMVVGSRSGGIGHAQIMAMQQAHKDIIIADVSATAGQRTAQAMSDLADSFKKLELTSVEHEIANPKPRSIPHKHKKKRKFHN